MIAWVFLLLSNLFFLSKRTDCSVFGCLKCSENNPNICIDCIPTLVLSNKKCNSINSYPSKIAFCAEYFENNDCKTCEFNYSLINNSCIPIKNSSLSVESSRKLNICSDPNCLSCYSDYCQVCNKGFFMSSGVCISLPDNCL